jgi:hypothetical protein
MSTNLNDILAIMLGFVTLLILIKHALPSLSSFFGKKIMGMGPSEIFDLNKNNKRKSFTSNKTEHATRNERSTKRVFLP